ncbi:MAG: TIGR03564 family F420-dependent LLM class oxidoreductase [Deltaproteobacteria bacterium]|nr:TIGR03564 family F420-dependent LLM class oxidoreductase [Deltaproteobacteria bacterium]
MRIGIMSGDSGRNNTLDALVARGQEVERRGFAAMWMANIFALDAILTLAIVGRETKRIELGTAVVPTYPRHPFAMAQEAMSANMAAGGRFALGIGLSHKLVIEDMLGLSYEKPARHMREYLDVLAPLMRGEQVKFSGEVYRVATNLSVDSPPPALLVAAMGDAMLKLTGERADGTVLWMTGAKTIQDHVAPKLAAAARAAGRPAPRIAAGIPIAATNDVDGARAWTAKNLVMYGHLPSYRAMLDREGLAGPADLALVGDEKALDAGLARLRDAGVTDFIGAILPVDAGADQRTLDYLQSRLTRDGSLR